VTASLKRVLLVFATAGTTLLTLTIAGLPQAHGTAVEALVSVGSPINLHPRNAQNEPALAVDPLHPSTLVAGSNDLVDMQPCSRDASTKSGACSYPLGTFNLGVGLQGVYFSFDNGHNWVQPTYQGLTAAGCDPTADSPTSPCQAEVGDIHTVPNFYENGLRSRSDPGVAFGPKPGADGTFSWSNGTRLYYSTLATNLTDTTIGTEGQNTPTSVVVSHFDDLSSANYQDQSRWSRPFFVDKNVGPTAGLDKEQVWADNAATSDSFGNVYVCYTDFHSFSGGLNFPLIPMVGVSRDGGTTWSSRQVAPPTTATPVGFHQGCTVRTDSHGVVYVFFTHSFAGTPGHGFHQMIKSVDGTPVPLPRGKRIISTSTAAEVRKMLEGVVRVGGTGTEAAIDGYTLAGKTGTANKIDPKTGEYSDTAYVASFVGFAPARDPKLLVTVTVDEPKGGIYGGEIAAPAFQRIAQFALPYLGIPPS